MPSFSSVPHFPRTPCCTPLHNPQSAAFTLVLVLQGFWCSWVCTERSTTPTIGSEATCAESPESTRSVPRSLGRELLRAEVASTPAYTGCVAAQHSVKNGEFSIICTVLLCYTMCEHSPWQQLFLFFKLPHADITLRLRTLCGGGLIVSHWRDCASTI